MKHRRPPFPMAPIPQGGASGLQYQRAHALGQLVPVGQPQPVPQGGMPGPTPPTAAAPNTNYQPDRWIGWSEIPAAYTVSITLPGTVGAAVPGSSALRPEPFVLKRIAWATTSDTLSAALAPFLLNSLDARAVEVSWSDEFTKFFGEQPCLVAAAFGESNGYLDLPAPVLFQGRQSLYISLRRLFWPYGAETTPPQDTRWDFQFQGIALLPPGVGSSGSVR